MMSFAFEIARKYFLTVLFIVFGSLFIISNDVSALKVEDCIAQHGNTNIKMTKDSFVFYDLTAKDYSDPSNPFESSSKYFFKGKLIVTDQYGGPVFDMIEISDDYPMPGLITIVIPTHGGMTAYGWAYHVFVLSGNALAYTIFETEFSCSDQVLAGNGLLDITQHSMNCPLGIKGDLGISFYTAVHPRYSRYYVYDNAKWRQGRIGELKDNYDRLFSQATSRKIEAASKDNEKYDIDCIGASLAEETYYCIMSGKPDSVCKKNMNNRLPKNMKWITDSFYATVKEDADIPDYDIETTVYK